MANKPTYEELEQRVKELEKETFGRKRSEEMLQRSTERFRRLFEHMSSGVAVYESVDNGEDFVFRAFNPEAEKITHISQREALGNRLLDLFPHMDKSGFFGALKRVWKTGQEEHLPPFYYKDDMREGWRENRIYKLPTGEVVALFDDVTERTEAEESLAQREQYYRSLIFSLHEDILVIDRDYRITDINHKTLRTLGLKREEVIGRHCYAVSHGLDTPCHEQGEACGLRIVFDTGESCNLHHEHITADGKTAHIDILMSPLRDEDGNVSQVIEAARDVTDLFQAEETLRESEERYRELAGSLPEIVFETDEKGNLTFANHIAFDVLGYTREDFEKGLNALQMLIPEDHDRALKNIQRVLKGEKLGGTEYTALTKDGRRYPAMVYATPIIIEEKSVGMRGIVADLTETKQAQKALLESEEKFRSLAENQHDVVWTVNENLEIDYISPSCFRITGTTAEETIGKNPKEFYTEESYQKIILKLAEERQKPANEMQPVVLEVDQYHENGHLFPAEITCIPIIIDSKFVGIQGITRDITDRKKAAETIRQSEAKYRTLVEESFDGIFIQKGAKITFANQRFHEMLGYNEGELKGLDHCIVYHPESQDLTRERAQARMRGEAVPTHYEVKLQRKNGSWFYGEVGAKPVYLDGEAGVQVWVKDIMEHKQAVDALQESEERLQAIFEASPNPIVVYDSEGNLQYLNAAFTELFAWSLEELRGRRVPFVPDDQKEISAAKIDEIYSSGKPARIQTRRLTKAGDTIDVLISAASIKGSEGKSTGMVVNLTDLSEQIKLQTQLQQAQKMEAIGTLAGGIAHDFNNILGGIIGYAELAKMKAPEGSNVIAYLDKMIKSSDRAADLIKQILTLSRQHKQEQRPVQARHIVKEALDLLRATLPTTIEIRKDLAKDANVVNADPTQMHQVIMNLATNAGYAMQEHGGVLEVTLANVELDDLSASKHLQLDAGSYLRLTVSDTGHGMTAEIMERIFDPYFTTKDTGEGTGLGLSVAQGIVKAHGGTITVYSEMRKGTTFHVYLPIILEEERAEKQSLEPLPTGSERILFIDDEEILVEIGSQLLEQLGYEVVPQKSSTEALALFRSEPDRFDLVITDMTMPKMTGDKLALELMKIRPDIPIVLCTGHSKLISEKKAMEMGIRAFIGKPITKRAMAETVRKVLDAGGSQV